MTAIIGEQTKGFSAKLNSAPVLCVDLDGTLLATDLLWEQVLQMIKQMPWAVFLIPFWLLRGKAHLKRQVAQRVKLNAANLPYRQDVLEFLYQEKGAGREVVLATASDQEAVMGVAQHLGIFSEVIASDGKVNLKGRNKRKALEERFGSGQFDYFGNAPADLHMWRSANAAFLVGPSKRLLLRAQRVAPVRQVFPSEGNRLRAVLKALRVYQWVKNALIFVPLVMAHALFNSELLLRSLYAFLAFSFCASSVYILNDLLDLESDRQHPKKRFRPFAAGTLPISMGVYLAPLMLTLSFLLAAATLPRMFLLILVLYIAITTAYSFYIKRVPVMDVFTLAGLYTLRVLAGALAVDVPASTWLLAFSMFLFLSLAFAKRYAELSAFQTSREGNIAGRGYIGADKDWFGSMGSASGYLSVLVLALYINSKEVAALYRHPQVLWLVCALLLYWITRIWFLAHRGKIDDDPIVVTIKDPISYRVGLAVAILLLIAI